MTQDEIIEMAREAGFVEYEIDDGTTNAFDKRYEFFAKLVAAKEREVCARVCESINSLEDYYGERTELACVEAIRARGQA